jgi:protein SCO1
MRAPLLFLLAAAAVASAACSPGADLPELYPVPETQLTDHHGRPVNLADLRGEVVVYDFIFTRCNGPCPMMTSAMKRVAGAIDRKLPVRFASISVDPDYDTPEVLREYARHFRVDDDDRWLFLTGERESIVSASSDGFKLGAIVPEKGSDQIVHSTRFVLADASGTIRGYYDAMFEEGEKALVSDIRRLAKR